MSIHRRILSISHDTPQLLDKAQVVFALMRETLGRFGGMMARFNVDDKGTIMCATNITARRRLVGPPFPF